MQQVLGARASVFWSPAEFAPFGTDLTLHTNTVLPSAVAASLSFLSGSVATGTNAVIGLHLFLNFAMAYALAFRITRSQSAAFLGGLVFGWSPYIASHLAGHFNLIAAWTLPLTVLALDTLLERGGRIRAALTGVVLGGTIYVDYYYAVYAGLLVLILLVARSFDISLSPKTRLYRRSVMLGALTALLAVDLAFIMVIAVSGGTALRIGGTVISMRSTHNPVAAAGLLLLLAGAVSFLPRWRVRINHAALWSDARRLVLALSVAICVAAPLLMSAIRLWHHGGYVSQTYLWKSAPAGVDLATLVVGNPGGLFWGALPSHLYQRFGIDPVEQVAWIGPATLILCIVALRIGRREHRVWRWCITGGVFMLWALGPYVVAFGHNLGILLPATLVRYIPIVSNARIPARAMVVVYLSLAIICALGFSALRGRRRTGWAVALLGVFVLDSAPRSTSFYSLDHPAIYDVLLRQPQPGAVCELPIGLRDGFGETGIFDSRTLWYQTIHKRPITGGFVARMTPGLITSYNTAPVLGSLLRLSSGEPLAREPLTTPASAAAALHSQGIRFIVINRDTSPPDLLLYIRLALPLRLLATDGRRELYMVQEGS